MAVRQGKQAVKVAEESASAEVYDKPLYGVAMLKVALELKKPSARSVDEILSGVLAKMSIDETQFRRFLLKDGGLLRSLAQKKSARRPHPMD